MVRFLLFLLGFYQKAISPLLPARCRFYPTCSAYGRYALRWHGVRGIPLVVCRILRCQPWGGSGVDFVPIFFKKFHFVASDGQISFVYKDKFGYTALQNHLMKG
ncbi:MAG: membrane protein insertion efficiency factor YidD [Moraxella sp.]|nr:membrane protein insertion efficiency factor YidD [Moraxella sp.]